MRLRLLLLFCILASTFGNLQGNDADLDDLLEDSDERDSLAEDYLYEDPFNEEPDSDPDEGKSIPEKIDEINKVDKAPKCLVNGDIMPEDCSTASKRNAVRDRARLWRSRKVPYYLHSSLGSKQRKAIKEAIEDYHKYSCIRFTKYSRRPSNVHYIEFFQGKGCWSSVGKTRKSYQRISLGRGCGSKGIAIHELMHALGFWHEQSRYDRDSYVRIHWENIKKDKEGNFKKKSKLQSTTLGLPYDYDGVMHYGKKSFSKNGKITIERLRGSGKIGQRKGFSYTDIAQLNALYNCERSSYRNSWSDWSQWSKCIDMGRNSRERRQRFCFRDSCNGKMVEVRERACGTVSQDERRAIFCEKKAGFIQCPYGYRIHIINANYGRTSKYICNGPKKKTSKTNCRSSRSYNTVKGWCHGKWICAVSAKNKYFKDPCRGTYKYLDVKYKCLPSRG